MTFFKAGTACDTDAHGTGAANSAGLFDLKRNLEKFKFFEKQRSQFFNKSFDEIKAALRNKSDGFFGDFFIIDRISDLIAFRRFREVCGKLEADRDDLLFFAFPVKNTDETGDFELLDENLVLHGC